MFVRSFGGILMNSVARIGILGGGFGGLYAVFYLRKYLDDKIDITLFDKNNW